MNESGATAFEVRQLIKALDDDKIRIVDVRQRDYDYQTIMDYVHFPYRDAILCEALNCLADKKEAERGAYDC
jgi:hypothetical protein